MTSDKLGRVVLLALLAIALAVIVLLSAVRCCRRRPEFPQRPPPFILDRPEACRPAN